MSLAGTTRNGRGSALLGVLLVCFAAMAISAALLHYASQESIRARGSFKPKSALYCAESGLQYARSFFGHNYARWNTYLAQSTTYNIMPVKIAGTTVDGVDLGDRSKLAELKTAHPELFGDIDGDGVADFFVYIRDNVDQFPTDDPRVDNDQVVVIGSVCLNDRLNPKNAGGALQKVGLEAFLVYSSDVEQYGAALGTGNMN